MLRCYIFGSLAFVFRQNFFRSKRLPQPKIGATEVFLRYLNLSVSYIVMKKGIVKHKVTHDYILDLYDKAKKLKSKEKKAKMLKEIRKLTRHIGEYVVKYID